jgi:hypothetical protein
MGRVLDVEVNKNGGMYGHAFGGLSHKPNFA